MGNFLGKYDSEKLIYIKIGSLNRPIPIEKTYLPKISCLQHTHTQTHTLLLCPIIIIITGPPNFPREFYQIIKDQRQGQRERRKTSKYFYKASIALICKHKEYWARARTHTQKRTVMVALSWQQNCNQLTSIKRRADK